MAPSIRSIDDHEQEKMKADASEERPMETVGGYLKKEREAKRLSLHEVAQLTKISELYLDCIEKDDFDKIPKGPYVKGYISSYSRMIGGDTEQAIRLYEDVNAKKTQTDETMPATQPPGGWKASMATAFASMGDWLRARRKIRPDIPVNPPDRGAPAPSAPSMVEIKKTSSAAAPITDRHGAPAEDPVDKVESSVLIPFKRVAPPSQAGETGVDAPAPPMPTKTGRISTKAAISSIYQRLVEVLGATGLWLRSIFLKLTIYSRPIPSRRILAILAVLLLGGMVLVFSAIGVYHVFFFDPRLSVTTDSTDVTGMDSADALSTAPQPSLPHKTSRFKKPDSPLPEIEIARTPPAPAERPTPVLEKTVPAPTVAESKPVQSESNDTPAVTAKVEAPQPTDIPIKVMKATICSAIEDRMPADIATVFPLSVDRVYVWTHVQAEHYPTAIRHIYFHEGQMVNQVELSIRSPFWRTWSFKSIDKDSYRGHWRVDITTADGGEVLRRLYFEID